MSDNDVDVVTRFAANPTRHLDVGDARFALLNCLYAMRHKGRFLLRMDDVGRAGAKKEFSVGIRNDLRWLGIDWSDEITQSARTDRYLAAFEDLKVRRLIYPCYETADELVMQRKQSRAAGQPPIYDRAALKLSPEERAEIEASGKRPHWRFRLDDEPISWVDEAQREISIPASNVSDPVVLQGEARALYALSSVVDDVDHGVTHVVASDDLVATTAAQIQIYYALNVRPPVFAHVSAPVSREGETMSRRLFPVRDLKARGLEPLTVSSLLVTVGTRHGINARLALEELANRLLLAQLGGAATAIEPTEFDTLNPTVVRALPFRAVRKRLAAMGLEEVTEPFWLAVRPSLNKLSDAEDWWKVIRGPCQPVIEDPGVATKAANALPPGDWDETTWLSWKRMVGMATKLGSVVIDRQLRLAVTGVDDGPEMSILLPMIGRARVQARLAGKAT